MSRVFAVGDLQGERRALAALMDRLDFDPGADRLILLGDLVNRGHDSLGTLRAVRALGSAATVLLGNHDLHLLAAARSGRLNRKDTLQDILDAPDRDELLHWLGQQRLAYREPVTGTLCVHAGVAVDWRVDEVLRHAAEVEAVLRSDAPGALLAALYGNQPDRWSDQLVGVDRLRYIVNALTRQRMVYADGRLEFRHKLGPDAAPAGLLPWFAHPGRASRDTPIVFGHWSTLGKIDWPEHRVRGLDTGCVWGGPLTAIELISGEVFQVRCGAGQ